MSDARVQPMVTIVANDNWVELAVRYVTDYKKRRSTKDLIFTRILEKIERSEGQVKMSSTTQEIVGFPELSVKLDIDQPPAS